MCISTSSGTDIVGKLYAVDGRIYLISLRFDRMVPKGTCSKSCKYDITNFVFKNCTNLKQRFVWCNCFSNLQIEHATCFFVKKKGCDPVSFSLQYFEVIWLTWYY